MTSHISYLIYALLFTLAYSQCFELTGSKACGAFDGSLLRSSPHFTNVETLDDFVSKRVGQAQTNNDYIKNFRSDYDCPNFKGDGQEQVQTIFCAQLIAESIPTCKESKPPLLCEDTCKTAIKSLVSVFRSNDICRPATAANSKEIGNRNRTVGAYHNLCYTKKMTSNEKGCVVDAMTPVSSKSAKSPAKAMLTSKSRTEASPEIDGLSTKKSDSMDSDTSTDSNDSPNAESNANSDEKGSAESSSSSESTSPPGSNTLLYSLIGGSIASILAIIGGVLWYRRTYKKSDNPFKGRNSVSSFASAPEVIDGIATKHYYPDLSDEMGLHVGDRIEILEVYDDGWALGDNVSTGTRGVFPMTCVKTDAVDETGIAAPSSRVSSLYGYGKRP